MLRRSPRRRRPSPPSRPPTCSAGWPRCRPCPPPDLKQQWRELFGKEPPPFNRPYLQSRLAYRIQELAYGGLKPETRARLEALGEQLDGGNVVLRRIRADSRPLAGTRLVREWQGVQHVVTVRADDFEYEGRPYRSLSAIARAHHRHALERLDLLWAAPAGWRMSRRTPRGRLPMPAKVRKLRCAVYTRKSTEEGLDKEFNTLDAQRDACEAYVASPARRGLGAGPRPLRRRRLLRRHAGAPGAEPTPRGRRARIGGRGRHLQAGPAVAVADGFRAPHGDLRSARGDLRLGDAELLHDHLHGPADAERPAQLRAVRARGDRRAHPRQGGGLQGARHVDGRQGAARLRRPGPQAGGERGRGRASAAGVRALRRDGLRGGGGAAAAGRGRHQQVGAAARQGRRLQAAATTAPTPARSRTRARSTPASTRPSCRGSCGTARTRSCRRARGSAPTRTGSRRRRC